MISTKPKTTYAIRARRNGKAIGWVAGISFDLITGGENLHLHRYRKGCVSFADRKAATDWIQSSPGIYGKQGYSFDIVGKRHKEEKELCRQ